MARRPADQTEPLDPAKLYPIAAFRRASGLSETRIREARRQGVPLPLLEVGRRRYVRGEEGIRYIERLAELAAEKAVADLADRVELSAADQQGDKPRPSKPACTRQQRLAAMVERLAGVLELTAVGPMPLRW